MISESTARSRRITKLIVVFVLLALLVSSAKIAGFLIEYNWWKEVGQVGTWLTLLAYRFVPGAIGAALAVVALWTAHHHGLQFAGIRLREVRLYGLIVTIALALLAVLFAYAKIDYWATMRYIGSLRTTAPADAWTDPVFARPLTFYLFSLPFYWELLGFAFALWVLSAVVFWAAARGWQLADQLRGAWNPESGPPIVLDATTLLLTGATRSNFVRVMGVILALLLAVSIFLGNYQILLNSHAFMVGADYVDEKFLLPLRWLLIFVVIAGGIPLLWTKRYVKAVGLVVAGYVLTLIVPGIVRAAYVRPNEISIEKPYIERHLQATSAAFGLNRRATTRIFPMSTQETIDAGEHATLLENIRLWDWRAYTDTITQIQALRPYYAFPDTDVDRYTIDGRIKQVLLSPREIDVRQLPADARQSWVNPHLVYTHGFGIVMSEVNKTTPDGLPELLIENAPPEIKLPDFPLVRPEIYFGESTHDPVFVNTVQQEFDYPSGDQNKYSRYEGNGGFPIDSLLLQSAAALALGDSNILFTRYFTGQSRMMIHRNVRGRLEHLAGFILWDADPYIVVTDEGRLFWMVDGYTTSQSHPYSATLPVTGLRGGANYIRNAVKATVDAYNGNVSIYIFDPDDPIITVYQRLLPMLFHASSEMPADLRRHARYPEGLFRTQAEAYRTFHMLDPQVFYNKEDVWEVSRSLSGQTGQPQPMTPMYVVATLPGETAPEFLLMLPFAPRGKDNLIGWMAARCDGDRLGELVFFQLSKQQLVYGPMQIESRIDQDENISKDLSLWNQQGSRVLRGNLLSLPFSNAFLYIESIYIQANEARMPQLKKIVLAMGNRLIYRDTFEEAVAELTDAAPRRTRVVQQAPSPVPAAAADRGMPDLAERLRRLREQARRLVDEIDAVEKEVTAK
ncbi:MAG: UPF0182 family protein [Acidobacteria bacterium]|nr:UPF0182 family protein [Acidobacteriota bacterium]